MYHVRQENLPFVGSSHEFVGAEQGDTNVSVFLFHGKPGSGPGPHRHPYDEIQFIREGRGVWTLSLIHISEPTRQAEISYAVFCLKKKKKKSQKTDGSEATEVR